MFALSRKSDRTRSIARDATTQFGRGSSDLPFDDRMPIPPVPNSGFSYRGDALPGKQVSREARDQRVVAQFETAS
jgi:hypothetical protein